MRQVKAGDLCRTAGDEHDKAELAVQVTASGVLQQGCQDLMELLEGCLLLQGVKTGGCYQEP